MATRVAAAGGGNWTAGGTWVGGVAPTAADDAQIPATAGNITIDTGAVCRSADFSTYTGTLTHTAGVTLAIGDGTAGLSNIALKLVAGMTYTLGNVITSAISFISTSATQQTIDYGGKTTGNVTFNGAGNSYLYSSGHTQGATATVTLTTGTLNINGQTCSWGHFIASTGGTKTYTLGAAAITITGTGAAWDLNPAGTTFSGASSTLNFTGGGISVAMGAALTYGTLNYTGSGNVTLNSSSAPICTNFNRTGTATKTDSISFISGITVSGTFTLAGNSATNRLFVSSGATGTSRTITNTGATQAWSNVDLMDIALSSAYDASAITGLSGDAGGNSNITFTTGVAQTWSGTVTGNWSTNAWTTRVPLPQDDVAINAAFSGGQSVTADMPRLGKNISWVGTTGNPTWVLGSVSFTIYGSLTLIAGMACSGNTGKTHTFSGRGTHTITTAGVDWRENITIAAPGGSYTLQDSLLMNGSGAWSFTVTIGSFDTNNFAMSIGFFFSNSSNTRSITFGSSVISLQATSASTIWVFTASGLTLSAGSSTITLASATANTRTFGGGGLTYGTLTYTVAGSTGGLNITGANTFNTINFSDITNARTLQFTAGTTTTITGTFNVMGTAGKLMSVQSITAATHTLSKSSGTISEDYLNLTNSIATGGATWYAGANSTDSGGNTGWIFTAPPTPPASGVSRANSRLTSLSFGSLNSL